MHRFNVAWAITAIALLSPTFVLASEKQTGQQIADALKESKRLVGFRIGVKYQDGTAWLKGHVSSEEQKALAVEMTRQMPDVSQVIDELTVKEPAKPSGPVLRSGDNGGATGEKSEHASSQPLVAEKPVVRAAKTPRGMAGGLLRPDEPTIDPNVQTTAGLFNLRSGASRASSNRSIIRRRRSAAPQTPTPATKVRSTPSMTQVAMPNVTDAQGRKMKLIPLVRGADGKLVPLDPAMAERMNQGNSASQQSAPTRTAQLSRKSSGQAKVLRRGQPMPMATRTQGGRPVPVAYNRSNLQGGYAAEPVPAMEGVPGAPLPATMGGPVPMGGPAPAYYDQPSVPNYAWPSYAAHPNYAALTYPKQYSPTAWPYIGPFYPYPQVPLGWRKVSLEWDDGWWFLDFDDKNCH